ncbi:hypothetical protein DFQ26_009753 [Actinomortierella ambigua]|nr:hypothetical protein DFQ26_009753 [Actinomortierella ambigua]
MRLSTGIVLLASAALALAQDAVVSLGVVHGFDYSDPNAEPLEVFKQSRNHLIAVASILQFQGKVAHYTPHKQLPAKSTKAFKTFEEGVEASPLWALQATYAKWPALKKGGLDDLQQAIAKTLPHHEYRDYIARHLTDMVPTVVHDPSLKRWALSIVAVRKIMYPEDAIIVGFGKLVLDLELTKDNEGEGGNDDDGDDDDDGGDGNGDGDEGQGFFIFDKHKHKHKKNNDHDHNKNKKKKNKDHHKKKDGDPKKKWKVTVPTQVADLDLTEYKVDRKALVDNAESLANQIALVTLEEFIDFFTSPADEGEDAPPTYYDFADDEYQQQSISCRRPRRLPLLY